MRSRRNAMKEQSVDDEGTASLSGRHSTDLAALVHAGGEPTQLEIASFIEMLSAELRGMAKAGRLESLAYFLEMVRIEASLQVDKIGSAKSD